MAAAFSVSYRGPNGDCPDCVVIGEAGEECVGELAAKIKSILVASRGGHWQPHEVVIRKIEYIGPWYMKRPNP